MEQDDDGYEEVDMLADDVYALAEGLDDVEVADHEIDAFFVDTGAAGAFGTDAAAVEEVEMLEDDEGDAPLAASASSPAPSAETAAAEEAGEEEEDEDDVFFVDTGVGEQPGHEQAGVDVATSAEDMGNDIDLEPVEDLLAAVADHGNDIDLEPVADDYSAGVVVGEAPAESAVEGEIAIDQDAEDEVGEDGEGELFTLDISGGDAAAAVLEIAAAEEDTGLDQIEDSFLDIAFNDMEEAQATTVFTPVPPSTKSVGGPPRASAAISKPGTPVAKAPSSGPPAASPVGYLFISSNRTQSECEKLKMFGSMPKDLYKIKQITPDTNIFMLNVDTLKLTGVFAATSEPGKDLLPNAFGGRFGAQVPVMPIEGPLREQQLDARIPPGPKTQQEVKILKAALKNGKLCPAKVQMAWGAESLIQDQVAVVPSDLVASDLDAPFSFDELPDPLPFEPLPDDDDELELAPASPSSFAAPSPKYSPPSPAETTRPVVAQRQMAPKKSGVTPALPKKAGSPAMTKSPAMGRSSGSSAFSPGSATAKAKSAVSAMNGPPSKSGSHSPAGGMLSPAPSSPPASPFADYATSAEETGYVFYCTKSTQSQCQRLKLFGSPDKEMSQMKQAIKEDSKLFLFNIETFKLLGPFFPAAPPGNNLMKGAFGGRFSAQVKVQTWEELTLKEATLQNKLPAGPKNAKGVTICMDMLLQHGEDASAAVQAAWNSPGEPPGTPEGSKLYQAGTPSPGGKGNSSPGGKGNSSPGGKVASSPAGKGASSPAGKGALSSGKRSPASMGATPPAKRSKLDGPQAGIDKEGRQYDLRTVVVNFANVGATYATKVLGVKQGKGDRIFDWDGVRKCVRYITTDLQMEVVGCIYENYWGPDGDMNQVNLPDDIRQMCRSVQETPRLTGRNHKSADDEMTIKCAYRRNCRFMDNDNYRDWLSELRDERVRNWLENCQDLLQMRYFFDTDLGSFDTIDGNVPVGMLAERAGG